MSYPNIIKCFRLSNKGVKFLHYYQGNFILRSHVYKPSKLFQHFDLLGCNVRHIHTTFSIFNKENVQSDSNLRKDTTPNILLTTDIDKLKESIKSNSNINLSNESTKNVLLQIPTDDAEKKSQEIVKKLPIWQRVKNELIHYYHGFKLLFLEIKVTFGILNTLTKGQSLSRRERKQLVRTFADLARMVPFLVFIIVPFMEFLLPFYIKFFPFMMPSTFQDNSTGTEKNRQILKGKLEIAKFLQETLTENSKTSNKFKDEKINIETFSKFLKEVRESGLTANTDEILRYSQLFEDEVTLESLGHSQLQALCKMLELNAMGPPTLLRFQLRMKVRHLKADDQLIASEGLEKVPTWELQQLCRERGMRSIGVSEERLRYQLSQWLNLHLYKKVPITLLLLTRIIYLPDTLTAEEKLKQAILVLPPSVSNEAKLKAITTEERVDNKTKFEVIKEEQKVIKKERDEAEKAAKLTSTKMDEDIKESMKPMEDKAIIIKTGPDQQDLSPKIEIPTAADEVKASVSKDKQKPAISIDDISKLESAIESLKETKEIFQKEELDDLKESREVISKEAIVDSITLTPNKAKDKVAKQLGAKVDKIINELDNMFDDLHKDKDVLNDKTKDKIDSSNKIKEERFISVADLKMTLSKMDLFPDDAKWQEILHLLDEDGDGMIEMDHITELIKLLTTEHVELSTKEVTKLLDLLDKEAIIAVSKKSNDSPK